MDRVANFLSSEGGWMEEHFIQEFDRLKRLEFKKHRSKSRLCLLKKERGDFVDELKNNDNVKNLQNRLTT